MTSVKSTDLTTTTVEPTESMGTSTATSPPASNTSTVTEATTEPVFLAQPPVTPFPVVRVFGTATNESQPLPADGVCDYTFYDGLYDTGPFDTLYSPHFSAPVEHVLSHASLHSVTEYGLSFAYRNASQVARDLEIPEPTELSPTPVEPTEVPTTSVKPTQLSTTSVEPTERPTTSGQPTELSMTSVKSTDLTTTTVEPTESMGTSTATSPPASNTSTVTEATTEPVFPAQPPVTPFPVVRVFGTATNESQPLPADGVCDYTFYDGLYDTGPFDTLYSPHFSAPVEHVLSHASLHSVTEYGLSFAYRNASQVARDLEIPERATPLHDLCAMLTPIKTGDRKTGNVLVTRAHPRFGMCTMNVKEIQQIK
ncbi:hypothetical protein MRX96_058815 [Rhipicephalus microplus]